MTTPAYQGQGQPIADSGGGWFGRLGSFFGGGSPTYASAPTAMTNETTKLNETAEAVAMCPIDPTGLPPGQIVLVVPRSSGI